MTYGPYRIDGEHTAPSNASFDESLRSRDARWGVRDLEAICDQAQINELSLVERVATSHGLQIRRHPSGFRHLSESLHRGDADVAGDESGGFAFAGLGCDKDGILACCLLAEICASTGSSLSERLGELEARHGRWVAGRSAMPATAQNLQSLAKQRFGIGVAAK